MEYLNTSANEKDSETYLSLIDRLGPDLPDIPERALERHRIVDDPCARIAERARHFGPREIKPIMLTAIVEARRQEAAIYIARHAFERDIDII